MKKVYIRPTKLRLTPKCGVTGVTDFNNPPEYELRLRPVKSAWPTPTVRRLAIVLKRLLRNYGFECVSAKEISVNDQKQ